MLCPGTVMILGVKCHNHKFEILKISKNWVFLKTPKFMNLGLKNLKRVQIHEFMSFLKIPFFEKSVSLKTT